jgi:hypothetical protein
MPQFSLRRTSVTSFVLLVASALVVPAAPPPAQAAVASSIDRVLRDPEITESSGLARSTYDRPLVWTHNDSGDGPRVFAVSGAGETRAILTLEGASARDWEDISTGPDHTLWVGDIGDNTRSRAEISVYRFREPRTLSSGSVSQTRFRFRYADGRHNAEGLMVRPTTGRVFVVTKSPDGGAIYRAPRTLSTSKVNVLRRVASAPLKITAASFAPGGGQFVLTNYSTAFFYPAIGESGRTIDPPSTRQGESVEFARGGGRVLLGSEGPQSPVHAFSTP